MNVVNELRAITLPSRSPCGPARAQGVQTAGPDRKDRMTLLPLSPDSRPVGAVALDLECDLHGGRLIRLWMARQDTHVRFGGEGLEGSWATDTSGRGAIVVTCTRPGCRRSARLTSDWVVGRLRQVRADFEAGRSLPIVWLQLSQAG
jgi:hypothetical protein